MKKGLEACTFCGTTIRPAARKVPHHQTPECRATVIRQKYRAKGWGEAFNSTIGKILEESGVPVEWAPAGVHIEQQDKGRRGAHGNTIYEDVKANHDVAFAPQVALRAATMLARTNMNKTFRRKAVAVLWQRPDLLDALEAYKRLKGSLTQSTVYKMLEADADEGPAKVEEPAQVLRWGGDGRTEESGSKTA
jgi:predicted RNA-binding Zn-ribbon protein involved in translation (DUF1610 family)